jgi:hypothetical protein
MHRRDRRIYFFTHTRMQKKNVFIGLGVGLTTLAVAIPVFAQMSGTGSAFHFGAPLTQADVQTLIQKDDAFLANIDAFVETGKAAMQAHKQALTDASSLTDSAAIQAAVKKANDDMRASMKAALDANPDLKGAPFGGFGGHGPHGGKMGFGMGMMLPEKLGMTKEELKAALDSGKTIQEIAKEKGVTLPARPDFDDPDNDNDDASSSTSSSQ